MQHSFIVISYILKVHSTYFTIQREHYTACEDSNKDHFIKYSPMQSNTTTTIMSIFLLTITTM